MNAKMVLDRLLLANLQIASLSSKKVTNIKSLQNSLDEMPTTLNETYQVILDRIALGNEEDQSLAHRALLWVVNAARFLKVDELLEVLGTDLETATFDHDLCTREEILLTVCLGLLHVEKETHTVHLVRE